MAVMEGAGEPSLHERCDLMHTWEEAVGGFARGVDEHWVVGEVELARDVGIGGFAVGARDRAGRDHVPTERGELVFAVGLVDLAEPDSAELAGPDPLDSNQDLTPTGVKQRRSTWVRSRVIVCSMSASDQPVERGCS